MSKSILSLSLDELERTAEFVHEVVAPTPQYAWPKLRKRAGCTVWVKHENHTPTSAFKVRGGLVYLDRLVKRLPNVPGVVSATRGNHGQSISFAAARAGVPAEIYVPLGNSPDQNTAMATFGAKVVEVGKDFDEAKHAAQRAATERQLHFIPSFHRDLVLGVATYALELFRGAPALDTVYVGVGMGSGICGLIETRDLLGLKTQIVGVSAVNAPATSRSFAAGAPVTTATALTFADGIATRFAGVRHVLSKSVRKLSRRRCGSTSMTPIRLRRARGLRRWRRSCRNADGWRGGMWVWCSVGGILSGRGF
jgi:threonine dehydratase